MDATPDVRGDLLRLCGIRDSVNIVGVNGIHTHGDGNIDLCLDALRHRGHTTVDVKLPYRSTISARWGGRTDGHIVALESEPGDILVCHSFGAVRGWYAHKLVEYKAIVLIAPAMSVNAEWRNPGMTFCYYSPDDYWVRIGSWLALSPFGRAGIKGFKQLALHGNNFQMRSDHDDYFDRRLGLLQKIVDHVDLLAKG